MRVVDDVGWLRDKLDQLDNPARNDQQQPEEGDIIATAFAARGLLEAIEKVNFRKYNHTLRTNIRTIRFGPDAPGSSEIVYHRDKCISLKYFCGAIIHLRNFTYNFRADGKHWLDVINDRTDRYQVFYSDFTSALKSLILSRRLVVLALCDLAEEGFSKDTGPTEFFRHESGLALAPTFGGRGSTETGHLATDIRNRECACWGSTHAKFLSENMRAR